MSNIPTCTDVHRAKTQMEASCRTVKTSSLYDADSFCPVYEGVGEVDVTSKIYAPTCRVALANHMLCLAEVFKNDTDICDAQTEASEVRPCQTLYTAVEKSCKREQTKACKPNGHIVNSAQDCCALQATTKMEKGKSVTRCMSEDVMLETYRAAMREMCHANPTIGSSIVWTPHASAPSPAPSLAPSPAPPSAGSPTTRKATTASATKQADKESDRSKRERSGKEAERDLGSANWQIITDLVQELKQTKDAFKSYTEQDAELKGSIRSLTESVTSASALRDGKWMRKASVPESESKPAQVCYSEAENEKLVGYVDMVNKFQAITNKIPPITLGTEGKLCATSAVNSSIVCTKSGDKSTFFALTAGSDSISGNENDYFLLDSTTGRYCALDPKTKQVACQSTEEVAGKFRIVEREGRIELSHRDVNRKLVPCGLSASDTLKCDGKEAGTQFQAHFFTDG